MNKNTLSLILRLPAEIILAIIALVPLYLKITNKYPMKWATPITLLIIVIAYFYGRFLNKKDAWEI